MSNASNRNFGFAQTERERRLAMALDDPGDATSAQAVNSDPGWQAFFGSLRRKEQDANAAGLNFRADLSGLGRPGVDGMEVMPGAVQSARGQAANVALGQMADQNREQLLREQAQRQALQQGAINDAHTSYENQVMASENAAPVDQPNISLNDQTGKLTMRNVGLPANASQSDILARLSPLKRQEALADMVKANTLDSAKHSPAYVEYNDAVKNGYKGSFTQYQNEDANRKNPELVQVQTVDEKGNKVTKFVPKAAGAAYAAPVSATLDNRLASAQAATQTGEDIVKDLHDPKFSAQIGPAMGRVNSLADWLGSPPPEYADLMGNIHSYALSQLGIHGMRSSQAAEQIRKDLSGIHTPEALESYINGLGKFSAHLLNNSGRTADAPAAPSAAPPVPSGSVEMLAPDGRVLHVPQSDVGRARAAGAKLRNER